jgi:hypothetical protein
VQQQKAESTKTRRGMAGKLCNACRDMQPRAGATELAQLPSPERTRLQRLPFFIYSFLTNHAVAKKGLPSRPRRQPSALLTGTSQFQVNNQSTSRDLTPVRPLPQQKPCLTSLRLLPETSHPDAFACRNARQQTVKSDERETLLSLFASRRAQTNVPARHPKAYCYSLHQP